MTIEGTRRVASDIITSWAGGQLHEIKPSGSMAKGTAVTSSADLDLFISLKSDTIGTWQEIHDLLAARLKSLGYQPRLQNVSLRINHNGINVDLVVGKKFAYPNGSITALLGAHDHSIRTRNNGSWTKTNIESQIHAVKNSRRIDEIKLVKIWRDINNIDFPSIYLELSVINALKEQNPLPFLGSNLLSQRFMKVIRYLASDFENAIIEDPGNKSNIISDDLSAQGPPWNLLFPARHSARSSALHAVAMDWQGELQTNPWNEEARRGQGAGVERSARMHGRLSECRESAAG